MQFELKNSHLLTEMARVGVTPDNIEIMIYSGEQNIPHCHFYDKQTDRKGCIRLDKAEYFIHGIYKDTLNRKEIKNFNSWIKTDKTVFKKFGATMSVYDYMCILWNENNPDYIIDFDKIDMPNYLELN